MLTPLEGDPKPGKGAVPLRHVLALLTVLATGYALPAWADTGYSYTLHEAKLDEKSFENVPPDYDGATVNYVEQGPEFTSRWGVYGDAADTTPAKATFARGERRMGLFIPFRAPGKSSEEAEGWASFGRPLRYDRFEIGITRGGDDRRIEGRDARHYTLDAEIIFREGENPNGMRHLLESDIWVLPSLPYSEIPFSVSRAYADPRLAAALEESLGGLGMIARVHSSYSQQPVDETGALVGQERTGNHMAWITGLQQGGIQDIAPPVVDEAVFDSLRQASRAQPQKDCATILAGGTPGFVSDGLDEAAHPAFLAALAESCGKAFPELASD